MIGVGWFLRQILLQSGEMVKRPKRGKTMTRPDPTLFLASVAVCLLSSFPAFAAGSEYAPERPRDVNITERPRKIEPITSSGLDDMFMLDVPVAPAPTPRQVSVAPPRQGLPRPTGEFTIQAGAFSVRENAERLSREISGFGAVQITEGWSDQGRVYRVSLGDWSSRQAALQTLTRLRLEGREGFIARRD